MIPESTTLISFNWLFSSILKMWKLPLTPTTSLSEWRWSSSILSWWAILCLVKVLRFLLDEDGFQIIIEPLNKHLWWFKLQILMYVADLADSQRLILSSSHQCRHSWRRSLSAQRCLCEEREERSVVMVFKL